MIRRCGLNRLNQFASFLSGHFRNARQDAKLLSMLLSLDDVIYSGLPLSQEEEQWALKSGIKLRVSHSINQTIFKMTSSFARIYSVVQKSELCYSPVSTTRTPLCSKLFPAPRIVSFRSTPLKMKASINPTLVYMNSLFLPIHRTARASFVKQTVTFILETSSKKCLQDGIYSVAEMTIGSSQRAVFDATPRPLKTTLGLCAVT